jgi:kumamolisin
LFGNILGARADSPADGVLRRHGIAECVRLPLRVDAARLADELDRLPAPTWARASRDPVVQASVDSFFAVGHPRGPRPRPPEDRPPLGSLPYLRAIVRELIPAQPTRVIVARLRPSGLIPIHTDTPRFFAGTVRLSIQVAAEGASRLFCDGVWYELAPGEVWAVDNLRPHGIRNASSQPRVNVLADYVPSSELIGLLMASERGLGMNDADATATIRSLSRERYRSYRWRGIRYEIFKRLWRRG